MTHGICRACSKSDGRDVLFAWKGKPLLRDAICCFCEEALERTASNLLKGIGPYGTAARRYRAGCPPLRRITYD